MSNKLQRDFTQGSIPRHLVLFALPMFMGSLLQAFYNTVDSIWVGRFLGPHALGAVSISFPLIMALLSLVMGLGMASTTMVAQYRGAGDERMVKRTVATSLLLLMIIGVGMSLIGVIFRYPLLALVQPPAEIRDQAAAYFGLFMSGILGMFVYNVLTAILRGLGDARTPLNFLAVATAVNVVLDPLFIFGWGPFPEMGVAGAALATIIAQGLSAILLWRWVRRNTTLLPAGRAEWTLDGHLARQIVSIGLPAGLQAVLVSFGMVAVTALISSYGPDVVAAFGAASRLDQFGFMPAMAIGMALSAMVGQNLGAGKEDRVRSTVRWAAILAVGMTAVITLVAVIKPTVLMVLFTDDPSVLRIGSEYLRYIGPAYVAFSLIFILGGAMRGAGDTVGPMIIALVALWGFRVPLAWYLSRIMGTNGIWLGIALSALAGLVLHWVYWLTGRWKKRVVVGRTPMMMAADD